ncbi:MAG: hypothetical protein P9M03_02790 [Candidatus Theseobacter exili]|nr:hypothetical protein [Candidatus Theseobacter exili]
MKKNKPFIEETIKLRLKANDPVKEFATRNKTSPIDVWNNFQKYTKRAFKIIYRLPIDGVKLKFRYVTLTFNGRHRNT